MDETWLSSVLQEVNYFDRDPERLRIVRACDELLFRLQKYHPERWMLVQEAGKKRAA